MDGRTFRENDDARGSQRARANTRTHAPMGNRDPSTENSIRYVFIYVRIYIYFLEYT